MIQEAFARPARTGVAAARGALTISDLDKSFSIGGGSRLVLDKINLSLAPGEFVSIVGASGCGKSTLLRLIVGLDDDYRGEIRLDGERVATTSLDRGIVFQDHRLFPWMTLAQNVELALLNTDVPKARRAQIVADHLALVNLGGFEQAYRRTGEFLDVFKGVWGGEGFSYDGRFYRVRDGGLSPLLARESLPELWFSGSSDAALQVAARHADYYLSWLEPFDQLSDKFARVKDRTAALGGEQRCAVRVDLVARPTEEEAWREIKRGFESLDAERRRAVRGGPTDSVGAARQHALRPSEATRYEDLIVGPNLWGGFNLLRGGPALGIVGSYAQCAAQLDALIARGADGFILAATPHLEEAFRVGEEVLPLLGRDIATLSQAAE